MQHLISPKVFISYSSKNKSYAKKLATILLQNGIKVWLDDWDILVGANIYDSVFKGIISCDYLAIILTKESMKSRWVKEELSLTLQKELEENKVMLLPLLFQNIELPLNLRMRKYADFTNWEKGINELMKLFGKAPIIDSVNQHVFEKIEREISLRAKKEIIKPSKEIKSQAVANIVSDSSIMLRQIDKMLNDLDEEKIENYGKIIIEIKSLGINIPMLVDFSLPTSHNLALIIKMLFISEIIEDERISYFLVYKDIPLSLEESFEDAGIKVGDSLHLGAYSYTIE